ncbi:Eco57I restriction-modification methylase domain-containing protein [Haliangium ochraceum]|uniref:site-specific DNA-methyltransferase (adenine-specific) n=1 Tax=Haliangium ochraceum (strain DSM 14365 / JCM 11303 / SMP-2) TaxID=502025 RepID=D0LRG3_HALO1|nr:DNA methyltransferase [Haliangium ochraceum]ACY17191.1 hypothetical protein Hoch_4701 [Haliangium ochraceum DSM 14365]
MVKDLRGSELDAWRLSLAHGVHAHAPALEAHDLDHAVQVLLDAMLFVFACESRGILPAGALRRVCATASPVASLQRIGALADARAPGDPAGAQREVAQQLEGLPSAVLDTVADRLYAPTHARRLAAMPPEDLGRLYEHALDRKLSLSGNGRLALETSPATHRSSGMYYTPPDVVDALIHSSVAPLFAGQPLKQAAKVKILDPACGSGSFLVGVYRYLLGWYRNAYLRAGGDALKAHLTRSGVGTWTLVAPERIRILTQHLHGVDLDPHAVALARRALYLEALEGDSVEAQEGRFENPTWPALDHNLCCGNTLVGPEVPEDPTPPPELPGGARGDSLHEAQLDTLKPFDWGEAFPEVFARPRPGFDVVLCDPPRGRTGSIDSGAVRAHLRRRYETLGPTPEVFRPFVEQGIRLLRRRTGFFAMVLPEHVLYEEHEGTRGYLLEHLALTHIDWWGPVLSPAADIITIVGVRKRHGRGHAVAVSAHDPAHPLSHRIPQRVFLTNERLVLNLGLTAEKRRIVDRLSDNPRVGDLFCVIDEQDAEPLSEDSTRSGALRALARSRGALVPYHVPRRAAGSEDEDEDEDEEHGAGAEGEGGQVARHCPQVLVRRVGDRLTAAVDPGDCAGGTHVLTIRAGASDRDSDTEGARTTLALEGLCALLNSGFATWYARTMEPRCGRSFIELSGALLAGFPLPACALPGRREQPGSGRADADAGDSDSGRSPGGLALMRRARAEATCADLCELGRQRAALAEQQAAAGEDARAEIDERCQAMDAEIDALVLQLYGVPAKELGIIEKT